LTLVKWQALDIDCNGPDTGYSPASITTGALPGTCIRYQITATNSGNVNVTNVIINDNTPTYTTYESTPAADSTLGSVTAAPANGATGTISANIGTLTPSASAVLTFGVKID
jgi:trimeric autotransporter adhesin